MGSHVVMSKAYYAHDLNSMTLSECSYMHVYMHLVYTET